MAERDLSIQRFLADSGWEAAERSRLAGDASFRRYERLLLNGQRAVLMDAPPPQEDVRPFRHMANLLQEMGFSAPRVLAADEHAGLLLLEDLGDRTFAKALADGSDPVELYTLATDTLIALQQAWTPELAKKAALPPYGDALLVEREAMLLPDWTAPGLGLRLSEQQRQDYAEAWREALAPVYEQGTALVLRDYFPDNLMLLDRSGTAACGLLDFQDAVVGPPVYDLASLLQDARRDVPAEIEAAMLERYLDAFPAIDRDATRRAYTVIAAQRHAKVIGIFTRLAHRDGKPGYLAHMPRLWRLLETALADTALAPVRVWFDRNLPPEQRRTPSETPPAETTR